MPEKQEWQELAQQICDESEPGRVIELAKKLVQAFDDKYQAEKGSSPPRPNGQDVNPRKKEGGAAA